MASLEEQMTLAYTYNKANNILNSTDTAENYLKGLSIVELFCQQHDDHYYVENRCNIDLNILHQIALNGMCACLKDSIRDRLQECVSILYEYFMTTEGV